jgi:hypothetical protein
MRKSRTPAVDLEKYNIENVSRVPITVPVYKLYTGDLMACILDYESRFIEKCGKIKQIFYVEKVKQVAIVGDKMKKHDE